MSLYRLRSLMLVVVSVLSACAMPIESSKDIEPGKSLVILQAHSDTFYPRGTLAIPEPHTSATSLTAAFKRVEPADPSFGFGVRSKPEELHVKAVEPGIYRFTYFDVSAVSPGARDVELTYSDEVYFFEVKPGEAVYIGNIATWRETKPILSDILSFKPFAFEIRLIDNEAPAEKLFNEKFADSGLKFTKRVIKKVPASQFEYLDR